MSFVYAALVCTMLVHTQMLGTRAVRTHSDVGSADDTHHIGASSELGHSHCADLQLDANLMGMNFPWCRSSQCYAEMGPENVKHSMQATYTVLLVEIILLFAFE